MAKRFPPDADKLVGFSLALFASGSRTEDRFWEARIELLLSKIFRHNHQATLDAALEHLQQQHPDAHSVLADLAEAHSESLTLADDGQNWDAVLIAAPVLVWTRYTIPSGPLKREVADTLRTHFQAHVLASGARLAMMPCLYSIDQLPHHHVEIYRCAQQLAQTALAQGEMRLSNHNLPQTSPLLADPRFLLAVAIAPTGQALFRWQEEESGKRIERNECLLQWKEQGGANLTLALSGCELECLLPDAYYAACRQADERIRPYTVRAAVRYLEDTLSVEANALRAVIGGFGEASHLDEYRIGFTRRGDSDVLYGVVWPLYGQENHSADAGEEDALANNPRDKIVALLQEAGIAEIRRHPGCFEPEYCDDCGEPLYPNPFGEIVHAEMPEDAKLAQPHFH